MHHLLSPIIMHPNKVRLHTLPLLLGVMIVFIAKTTANYTKKSHLVCEAYHHPFPNM
jgi:hypothetical protein